MKKGSVILNRKMTTQSGEVTAEPGQRLVSVFLGTAKDGDDPHPEDLMHNLGWRQMAMFETSVRVSIDHSDQPREDHEWLLTYSCLGAVDAVEDAVRFANKMIKIEFEKGTIGTPAPYLNSIYVGTVKVGPIGKDGTPFNGRGPAFFGWTHNRGTPLEDHLQALRTQAKLNAQ